jgi:1-aminocyclopropane-1-carboxylate deaminase/D-cysteine desulfhydrase-like pyridoxal-dependent ACC family enzyme
LEKIPWISLGDYPTRLEKLEKMGEVRGFSNLYIKRDDCCNPVYGGNKVRKLEYLLADAQRKKKHGKEVKDQPLPQIDPASNP